MRPDFFPTMLYLENGNGWMGSLGTLRYEVEYLPPVVPKEGDAGEAQPARLTAVWWYGPFSRPYAREAGRETFPLTAEGREALLDYLDKCSQEANDHPAVPPREAQAYYLERKQEEQDGRQAETRG